MGDMEFQRLCVVRSYIKKTGFSRDDVERNMKELLEISSKIEEKDHEDEDGSEGE